MKFSSYLTEATLLRRTLGFLAEINLTNKRKLVIRCPNLKQLIGCDTLGTRVWYSNSSGFNSLPTWELAEVDYGHLVCVNNELVKPLFNEALKLKIVKELNGYRLFRNSQSYEVSKDPLIVLEKEGNTCFVGVEHVTLVDKDGNAFFPEAKGYGDDILDRLMKVKKDGSRAVLFYAVTHTGAKCLKPAHQIDSEYKDKVAKALDLGVEFVAYKSVISLHGIELALSLPVLTSESVS